jgi:hypothetical protein
MLNQFFRMVGCAVLIAAVSAVPSWAQSEQGGPPGTVNYVEGEAWIGSTQLTSKSVRSAELSRGETLTTKTGKVELLLTPGVFLRVDDNSSVTMVSPDLADIDVTVDTGRAAVEALDIMKENDIRLGLDDVSTRLLDNGLYEFDAEHDRVFVFDGKAEVYLGNETVKLKGEHMVALDTMPLKAEKFDTRQYEDNFFRWCALRSGYLSEASVNTARSYVGDGPGWYGPGWYGPGWYWDPDFLAYTYLPADGVFYSPFGWGFYSPIEIYRSPFYFGAHFGRRHHRFDDFHYPYGHGVAPREGLHERGHRDRDEGGRAHEGSRGHGNGRFHGRGGFHGRHHR